MHTIDLILLGGAIVCFTAAYFIASKPLRAARSHKANTEKWEDIKIDGAKELANFYHDETN
jgi:hypothetical protein